MAQCNLLLFLLFASFTASPTSWSRCQDASLSHTRYPGGRAGTASWVFPPPLSCQALHPYPPAHGGINVPLYLHQWSHPGRW